MKATKISSFSPGCTPRMIIVDKKRARFLLNISLKWKGALIFHFTMKNNIEWKNNILKKYETRISDNLWTFISKIFSIVGDISISDIHAPLGWMHDLIVQL